MKNKLLVFFLSIVVITCSSCTKPKDSLLVDGIDVEQGDSILIKSPDNYTLLVDSGDYDYYRNVMRELKKNKVKKLDYVLGTHSDLDHIGSMEKIISTVPTNNLILSNDDTNKKEVNSLIKKAHKKNIRILRAKAKRSMFLGKECKIFFLSPSKIRKDNPNKNSIVFLLKYKTYNLLFTGDADKDNEKEILKNYNLPKIDLLKAGHHGSKTSSCEEFISRIRPSITLISCGVHNRYNHPHPDTISTLKKYKSKIFRTDKKGSILFYFDKDGIWVK